MLVITKEAHRNNGVEVDNNSTLWLNEKHMKKNWAIVIYQLLQENTIQIIENIYLKFVFS